MTFSPLALGLRLVLMLAGAACVGIAVRSIAGKPWVERQAERIDGLNVVVLFLFAVALMGDVAANTIARPLFVLRSAGAVDRGHVRAERPDRAHFRARRPAHLRCRFRMPPARATPG